MANVIRVVGSDYANSVRAALLSMLLHAYASDPMCDGEGLNDCAKAHLVPSPGSRP